MVCLGGTKNGLMFGEAVVVLDPRAAEGLEYLRKMNMQLASKMRFVSAQLVALLEGDLWLRSASHANAMAARLRAAVDATDGVRAPQQTESNAVFAVLPADVADRLRERFRFYDWDEAAGRCGGCAPSTPPRPTWTRSPRRMREEIRPVTTGRAACRAGRRRACRPPAPVPTLGM